MIGTVTNSNELRNIIQFVPFQIKITADYTSWSKVFADIEDVMLVVKKTNANANTEFLQKDYDGGLGDISINDTTKEFTIDINQDDFGNLAPDTYSIRLGIQFTGETQFRDVGVLENGSITIKESWFDVIPT